MKQALLTTVILILTTLIVQAQTPSVPPLINYQGMLTDAEGKALTGTRNLEFNLYDSATNGNHAWGPQIFVNVPLTNGQFNVILGTTDTAGRSIADAFQSKDCYLSVKIGDGQEISPRQQILSAPYALQAEKAKHHSNIIPAGTIVPYWSHTAPPGWLMCDGSEIPSDSEYEKLRAMVGNTVPDLRGVFLRGLNNGRNDGLHDPDDERELGSFQYDQFQSHTHKWGAYQKDSMSNGTRDPIVPGTSYETSPPTQDGDVRCGSETRPKNIAVNFIIKY